MSTTRNLHFPRWRNDTTQAAIVFHSAFHREMLNVTRLDDRFSFSLCSVLSFFLLFLYFFFFFSLFPGWESMRIITDNNDHKSADVIRDTHFFILSWNISSYVDFPFFKSVSESRLISLVVVNSRKLLNQDLHLESISLWFFIRFQISRDIWYACANM